MLKFKSEKTSRGPLSEGWRDDTQPIMCSYKLVDVRFDMNKMSQLNSRKLEEKKKQPQSIIIKVVAGCVKRTLG